MSKMTAIESEALKIFIWPHTWKKYWPNIVTYIPKIKYFLIVKIRGTNAGAMPLIWKVIYVKISKFAFIHEKL